MSVDRAEVRTMREEGLTLQAIGDHFGVTRARIGQIVGPSSHVATVCAGCDVPLTADRHPRARYCSANCRNRAYYRRIPKGGCVDCDKPCRGERCTECKRRAWQREQTARFDKLAALWATGQTMAEIAVEMGTTKNALGGLLCRARAAGWDLPLRRAKSPKSKDLTKGECRFQFGAAMQQGQIRRSDRCESCGRLGFVDGHHHDYQRPLYVTWLCPPCHRALHVERANEREVA